MHVKPPIILLRCFLLQPHTGHYLKELQLQIFCTEATELIIELIMSQSIHLLSIIPPLLFLHLPSPSWYTFDFTFTYVNVYFYICVYLFIYFVIICMYVQMRAGVLRQTMVSILLEIRLQADESCLIWVLDTKP